MIEDNIVVRHFGMTLAACVGLLALGSAPATAEPMRPVAVVELFTSQGCSSCPPADLLMGELATNDQLIVLTMPVNIWDYLGWRDTLATPENTSRQRGYSEARGDRSVYTPQVVINGREHMVGSNAKAIEAHIAVAAAEGGLKVPVSVERIGDLLRVDIPAYDQPTRKAVIWLALYERTREVPIKRGENEGQKITYTNVVRRLQPLGMWKGEAKTVEVPLAVNERSGSIGCAVMIQVDSSGRPGPILGAAVLATLSN